MARDGTHSRTTRSVGALGPVIALFLACVALLAVTKRKQHTVQAASALAPTLAHSIEVLSTPLQNLERGGGEASLAPKRHLPRFVTGTLAGVTAGIALGIIAAILITVADADVRSAVIVGAGLRAAQPTSDGEYTARVVAQAMNPNLAYADDAGVAALLARPAVEPESAVVMKPVEQDLRDNAQTAFIVLGALTIASWGLIMRGLSGASPGIGEAVVE